MPNAPEVKFKDKLVNNLDEKNTQDQWTPEELQETNEELEERNTSLESPEATDKPEEPELDENGKPRRKLNKKAYMCGIVLLLMFFAIAIYRTHTNGFGMIVQTVESYTYNVETLETPASFTINLDNLESNSGVSVYNDGDCSIEVSSVEKADDGYLVTFMATPKYDFFQNYALLVSATQEEYQIVSDGTAHLAILKAELTGSYGDETFTATQGESNDIGTLFTYTIPGQETTGEVSLTFNGLRKMNWNLK